MVTAQTNRNEKKKPENLVVTRFSGFPNYLYFPLFSAIFH